MQREIRPASHSSNEEAVPVNPDYVPSEPVRLDSRPRVPLTLYIYRVPGKKDLFLTQHKVPDNRPTAHDVNGCCYYVRYDDWPGPRTASKTPMVANAVHNTASAQGQMQHTWPESNKWRNMAQMPLCDQDLDQASGCKMTLVSVDTSHDSVQEVAVLLDPCARAVEFPSDSGSSIRHADQMFVDVYTPGYRSFGLDVAYFSGKAFTRRLFRPDPQRPSYHFASPWQGTVILEPHGHSHGSFQSYHRRPDARNVDAILACELRPNLAASHKMSAAAKATTQRFPPTADDRDFLAQASKRVTRIRNRSSQLSDGTKDAVAHFVATGGRAIRMGDRVDYGLALAREPLGGGTGDEAKLGKLVLYPEAHAFNDLAVAVNMLLFNRMYERVMPALSGV